MPAKARAAEFAKLLDFFDRLASGSKANRPTQIETHDDADADDNYNDPEATLAALKIPSVVANLASIVNTRNPARSANASGRSPGRPRRSTVAGKPNFEEVNASSDDDDDDEASLASFPLGKQYPFTFRLMLHKLYGLDDWLKKVQESLERSQMEYKPLAEKLEDVEREKAKRMSLSLSLEQQDGQDRAKDPAGKLDTGRRAGVRPRSFSVASISLDKPAASKIEGGEGRERVRPVKKRCVGRRKSMNGIQAESGRVGGGGSGSWVYDARVSRLEDQSDRGSARAATSATPAKLEQQQQQPARVRYLSLGGGLPRQPHVRRGRRVSIGGVMPDAFAIANPRLEAQERIMTRKRALTTLAPIVRSDAVGQKRPFTP